jgi:hypothetical protein
MKAHLGTDPSERARQEVGSSHPSFQRSERMFGRLPADLHFLGVPIQASLHLDEHFLVLPACHAPLSSRGAACFEGARATF